MSNTRNNDPGTTTRRTLLLGAAGAVFLGACSRGNAGAGDVAPSPSAAASPSAGSTGEVLGQTATPDAMTPTANNQPTPTRAPEVAGRQLSVTWQQVGNTALARDILREGQKVDGDPSAQGKNRDQWTHAVVLGVPLTEVARQSILNIATIPRPDNGEVTYAQVQRSDLAPVGNTLALRVRVAPENQVMGFVSGVISEFAEGASWAAEPTATLGVTTVNDQRWAHVPLV